MKARPISVTVAFTAMRISVWSSSASTLPNRKCNRSILVPRTEMMVTPTASEIRKNTASDASSFNSVARETRPASSATTKPATSPPKVIAKRLSPEIRKPMAAPGRTACAMASPTSDIRRSIRNTPMGPAPSASANTPTSARRMNSNSMNGEMKRSYMAISCRACRCPFVEGLAHTPRFQHIVRGQNRSGLTPRDLLARQQ